MSYVNSVFPLSDIHLDILSLKDGLVSDFRALIHSSDMSIIQKFLTNQIASNEIIIVMTPYCPTPQHLLHMQEGVN